MVMAPWVMALWVSCSVLFPCHVDQAARCPAHRLPFLSQVLPPGSHPSSANDSAALPATAGCGFHGPSYLLICGNSHECFPFPRIFSHFFLYLFRCGPFLLELSDSGHLRSFLDHCSRVSETKRKPGTCWGKLVGTGLSCKRSYHSCWKSLLVQITSHLSNIKLLLKMSSQVPAGNCHFLWIKKFSSYSWLRECYTNRLNPRRLSRCLHQLSVKHAY